MTILHLQNWEIAFEATNPNPKQVLQTRVYILYLF